MSSGTGAGQPAPVHRSMGWTLAPEVSFCDAGKYLVFLDLRRDRYFCLPAEVDAATRIWLTDQTGAPPNALVRNRLLVSAEAPAREIRACDTRTAADDLTQGSAPVTAAMLGRAVIASVSARASLRMRSLVRVLQDLPPPGAPADRELHAACLSFRAARRLLPIRLNCLSGSVALLRYLGPHTPRPTLVFGVTLAPFRAHCWVQDATYVLNDDIDTVSRFVPIRAL
ncbi:lasso peptide biosynthesis B2 protein [Sphingomonas soli]|uniref:lasso peptide biosynthesis B2 protein n=1 Tax=Sphingomonas soli TaxID=266127 RepID=UPI000829C472|nr:lasso peptide biosynthesis B2 protein [Sphingomonas soli]